MAIRILNKYQNKNAITDQYKFILVHIATKRCTTMKPDTTHDTYTIQAQPETLYFAKPLDYAS